MRCTLARSIAVCVASGSRPPFVRVRRAGSGDEDRAAAWRTQRGAAGEEGRDTEDVHSGGRMAEHCDGALVTATRICAHQRKALALQGQQRSALLTFYIDVPAFVGASSCLVENGMRLLIARFFSRPV